MKNNTEQNDAYKSLKSRGLKQKFREEWAKRKATECEKKQIKKQKVSHQELAHGTYLSFYKLWEAEGMDKSGYLVPYMHVHSTHGIANL